MRSNTRTELLDHQVYTDFLALCEKHRYSQRAFHRAFMPDSSYSMFVEAIQGVPSSREILDTIILALTNAERFHSAYCPHCSAVLPLREQAA